MLISYTSSTLKKMYMQIQSQPLLVLKKHLEITESNPLMLQIT